MPSTKLIIFFALLAIAMAPVVDFVYRSSLLIEPRSFNDEFCTVVNRSDFSGLEDITLVYDDESVSDFVAAYDPRRQTWLDHSYRFNFPATVKTGLVSIRIYKQKCSSSLGGNKKNGNTDLYNRKSAGEFTAALSAACIKVRPLDFIPLTSNVFHPHGIYFNKETATLYIVNHAMRFGGDRIEIFTVKRDFEPKYFTNAPDDDDDVEEGDGNSDGDKTKKEKKPKQPKKAKKPTDPEEKVIQIHHTKSLVWAATEYPPAPVNIFEIPPPYLDRSTPVAKPGSAYGIVNDVILDKINNRLVMTQWKSRPLARDFPRKKPFLEHNLPIIDSLLFNPTSVLSCPSDKDSCRKDPAIDQCIRSSQRFNMANGVQRNERGDVITVVDLTLRRLVFLQSEKIDQQVADGLPQLTTLGEVSTAYAADNIELASDNSTHFCLVLSVIQRIYEPGIVIPKNNSATTSGGASVVCCPYANPSAAVYRGVVPEKCVEDILFLTDGAQPERTQSGISVAVVVPGVTVAADNEAGRHIVLTGSWLDNGMGVCLV